jgi:hypothetical protein
MKPRITLYTTMVAIFHLANAFQQPSCSSVGRFRRVAMSANNHDNDNNVDPVLRLPLMEAELATTKDSHRIQKLEDEISNAKTAAEFGVRRAQVEFYHAFSHQDLHGMKQVWSHGEDVRCVHPGMESIHGLDDIMISWSRVFQGEPLAIQPNRVKIDISGQTALCSCIEETPNGGQLEALNVYRREGGKWRMTLHMACPIVMRITSSTGSPEI